MIGKSPTYPSTIDIKKSAGMVEITIKLAEHFEVLGICDIVYPLSSSVYKIIYYFFVINWPSLFHDWVLLIILPFIYITLVAFLYIMSKLYEKVLILWNI